MYNMDGKLSGPLDARGQWWGKHGARLSLIQGFSMAGTGTVQMDVDQAISIALERAETRSSSGEFGSLDAAQLAVAAQQPMMGVQRRDCPISHGVHQGGEPVRGRRRPLQRKPGASCHDDGGARAAWR